MTPTRSDDETRPETLWRCHDSRRQFLREQLNRLLTGYWRNLLQSQLNHVELLIEKNTVNILRNVAGEFALPMTSGRSFATVPPRRKTLNRYKAAQGWQPAIRRGG